jgi:hypothetical protein
MKKIYDEYSQWLFSMDYPTFVNCCQTFKQMRGRIEFAYDIIRINTSKTVKHDLQGFSRYHRKCIQDIFFQQSRDECCYYDECIPPQWYTDSTLFELAKILIHYQEQLERNGLHDFPTCLFE